MSAVEILNYSVSFMQQFGVVPFVQAGMGIVVIISVIAAIRRALSNS